MSEHDYADDPMKAMVRKYDAAVVKKGDRSIFSMDRPRGPFAPRRDAVDRPMTPEELSAWRSRPTHQPPSTEARQAANERRIAMTFEPAPFVERGVRHGRGGGRGPKPGRIVGGITGKLGGFMSDLDE